MPKSTPKRQPFPKNKDNRFGADCFPRFCHSHKHAKRILKACYFALLPYQSAEQLNNFAREWAGRAGELAIIEHLTTPFNTPATAMQNAGERLLFKYSPVTIYHTRPNKKANNYSLSEFRAKVRDWCYALANCLVLAQIKRGEQDYEQKRNAMFERAKTILVKKDDILSLNATPYLFEIYFKQMGINFDDLTEISMADLLNNAHSYQNYERFYLQSLCRALGFWIYECY